MSKELEALNRLISFDKECNYVSQAVKDDFNLVENALNELECVKHNYNAVLERYNNVVAYATKIQEELNEFKRD